MMLVGDEPLPSFFAQSYGHAHFRVEDFHQGVEYATDSLAMTRNSVTSNDPGPPGL